MMNNATEILKVNCTGSIDSKQWAKGCFPIRKGDTIGIIVNNNSTGQATYRAFDKSNPKEK